MRTSGGVSSYGFIDNFPIKSIVSSRRCAVIKRQDSAQRDGLFDRCSGVRQSLVGQDYPIANALVRSSVVIEVAVGQAGVAQSAIPDEPDARQALLFHRAKEAFDVRIAVGCARWDSDDGDSCIAQHVVKACLAEFSPAVVNHMRDTAGRQESGIAHGQIAGQLLHDDLIRMHGDQDTADLSRREAHDHGNHARLPSHQGQYRNRGEVDTGQGGPVCSEEDLPLARCHLPFRRRFDAVSLQYPPDRRCRVSALSRPFACD